MFQSGIEFEVISDKDVYISANILIEQHGNGAERYAIDMIKIQGGGSLWRRILEAIRVLQNKEVGLIN